MCNQPYGNKFNFLARLLLYKSSHQFHRMYTRTRFLKKINNNKKKKQRSKSENCSFAQEFALDLSNKLQDNFFKSFFLVLILLLSFNVTQGVLSLLRNGCFLSAVTWMFVQYCQSSARRNAVGDSRKIFHNDKVTLHGLNNVYDRFSLAREKL